MIPQPVILNRGRQKPWFSEVIGSCLELDVIEGSSTLGFSQYLQAESIAKITRKAYPRTTVAHRIKQAILLTQVRQIVETETDQPHPAVAEFDLFELREYT